MKVRRDSSVPRSQGLHQGGSWGNLADPGSMDSRTLPRRTRPWKRSAGSSSPSLHLGEEQQLTTLPLSTASTSSTSTLRPPTCKLKPKRAPSPPCVPSPRALYHAQLSLDSSCSPFGLLPPSSPSWGSSSGPSERSSSSADRRLRSRSSGSRSWWARQVRLSGCLVEGAS